MSKSNEGANISFRGLSRPYSLYPSRGSNIIKNLRVLEKGQVDNYLYVKKNGVGGDVYKDMDRENYTSEFDPFTRQTVLFPGMADFLDGNIEAGDKVEEDRLIASYWNDLGNDVFDDWGYFFLYDVVRGKYYFPLLTPVNQLDGVIITQTFSCFSKTFTIRHGWRDRGIFMMDISCSDTNFSFRFGAYGDFGSDGDEDDYDMTATYGTPTKKTLYYHHHAEKGDSEEILYSYFVPYNTFDNTSKPYQSLYGVESSYTDNNSLITKAIRNGIKVFFSKQYDVKEWIITDILGGDFALTNGDIKAEGNLLVEGQILSRGANLGSRTVIYVDGESDYYATSSIVDSYYISNTSTDHRTFYIPSAEVMASVIPNFQNGTSFRLTINNMANVESGYYWNLDFNGNVNAEYLKSSSVGPGCIVTYIVVLYYGEGVEAKFLQESESVATIYG